MIKLRKMRCVRNVARMGGFWCGNLRERAHLEDPGVDGKIILKWIFEKYDGGMDRIDLAQDRNRWQDLVNSIMNRRIP
jgi:hypothetical protein